MGLLFLLIISGNILTKERGQNFFPIYLMPGTAR